MTNGCGVSNSGIKKQYDIILCSTAEIRHPMNMALEKLSHSMWAWLNPNGDHASLIWKIESFFCQYKTKHRTLLLKLANYPLWSKGWSENIFFTLIFIKKNHTQTVVIFIKFSESKLRIQVFLNCQTFKFGLFLFVSKKETNLDSFTEILYKKVPISVLDLERF